MNSFTSLIDRYNRAYAFACIIEVKILSDIEEIRNSPVVLNCSVSYSYPLIFSTCLNYENNRNKSIFRNIRFRISAERQFFFTSNIIHYKSGIRNSSICKMIKELYSSEIKDKRRKDYSGQMWSATCRRSRDPRFK